MAPLFCVCGATHLPFSGIGTRSTAAITVAAPPSPKQGRHHRAAAESTCPFVGTVRRGTCMWRCGPGRRGRAMDGFEGEQRWEELVPSRGAPHAHCLYALKSVLTLRSLQAQGFLILFRVSTSRLGGGLGLGPPGWCGLFSSLGAPAASPKNLVADFLRPRSVLCTVRVVIVPICDPWIISNNPCAVCRRR